MYPTHSMVDFSYGLRGHGTRSIYGESTLHLFSSQSESNHPIREGRMQQCDTHVTVPQGRRKVHKTTKDLVCHRTRRDRRLRSCARPFVTSGDALVTTFVAFLLLVSSFATCFRRLQH